MQEFIHLTAHQSPAAEHRDRGELVLVHPVTLCLSSSWAPHGYRAPWLHRTHSYMGTYSNRSPTVTGHPQLQGTSSHTDTHSTWAPMVTWYPGHTKALWVEAMLVSDSAGSSDSSSDKHLSRAVLASLDFFCLNMTCR